MQFSISVKVSAAIVAAGAALTSCAPASYYQGSWNRHGSSMTIDSAGIGTVTYRTYRWCGGGVLGPCDRIVGNTIISGGRSTFRLTSPLAASTGTGVVTGGNQVLPGQRVTLMQVRTRNGQPTVISATGVGPWFGPLTFCGAEYVLDCGA